MHAKEPHWRNWIAHQTSNLGVEGSNPSWGAPFCAACKSDGRRGRAVPRVGAGRPDRIEDERLWRNGSASDSRPEGWGFESL